MARAPPASCRSITWHGASLLVVGLLVADEAVRTERVSTAQHLGVAVALETDHALQQFLHRFASRHVGCLATDSADSDSCYLAAGGLLVLYVHSVGQLKRDGRAPPSPTDRIHI